MAYTGNNSYEKEIYDKLIEAGFTDNDANSMARIKANIDKDYAGLVRKDSVGGFFNWLRNKI